MVLMLDENKCLLLKDSNIGYKGHCILDSSIPVPFFFFLFSLFFCLYNFLAQHPNTMQLKDAH